MDNNNNMWQPMNNQAQVPLQQCDNPQYYVHPHQAYLPPQEKAQLQQLYIEPKQEDIKPKYVQSANQTSYANISYNDSRFVTIKKIALIAIGIIAVILAIAFLPRIFKSQDPFAKVKLGDSVESVLRKYDIPKEEVEYSMAIKDVEGFGVIGSAQFLFYREKLDAINWYLYDKDCDSREHYEDVLEQVYEYYTEKYGEPENVEKAGTDEKFVWKCGDSTEIALASHGNEFILRYRYQE